MAAAPLLIWVGFALDSRTRALDAAEGDMRRAVAAVAEQSLKLLETQSIVLGVADFAAGDRDCAALRADAGLAELLGRAVRSAAQVETAWVLDAEGFLCASSNPNRMDGRSRAFRDYFSGARDAGPGRIFVDRAIVGLVDGVPAFSMARRRGEGEAFTGIVLSAVDLRDLLRSWRETLNLSPGQRVSLLRTDGATIARSWEPIVPPADAEAERRLATVWSGGPEGLRRTTSVVDGIRRVGAWRILPGWNVVVTSTVTETAALASWRRNVALYGVVALLASAALSGLVGLLVRARRRLAEANAELEARVAERTAALAESEALLRGALDAGSLVAWQWDLATGEVRRSGTAPQTLDIGTRGQVEEFLARIHPEDQAATATAREAALRGEAPFEFEYRLRTTDGREIWVSDRAEVERDAAGRPIRVSGITRDVSELRRADAARREREGELARVQRLTGTAGFSYDPRTDRTHRSPEYLAMHGMPPEAAEGSHAEWAVRIHPEDRPAADRALADAVAGRTPRYVAEYRVRRHAVPGETAAGTSEGASGETGVGTSEGEWRWIAAQADVERDAAGAVVRLHGAHLDITARKEAEAVLARFAAERSTEVARRDARLGAWFAHASEHLFAVALTADGRFVFEGLNPAHERATGLSAAALRGRTPAECFPAPIAAELEANYRRCAEAGHPIHYEEELDFPAGRKRWETSLVPVRDPATGRVEVILGSSRDVTEQRSLQAREAQRQRLEALGQLAGGIAHDMNNVMQAVSGGAALIRRRTGDAAAVDQLARMVEGAAQRGAAVTRRLLAFARRGELRAAAVPVPALFAALGEMLAHTLGPSVALRTDAPDALPPLRADRDQLETVLVNLATNARDAMPEGGTLRFSAAEDLVEPGTGRGEATSPPPGRYIRIAVEDTGEGMEADILARATDPFFTTKPPGQGTGLGLAMARSFAEQSGGALALRSLPGQGTTVTLWLPVAAEAAAEPPAEPPARRSAAVMVVDDEELVREVVAQGLEAGGFAVLRAPGGEAALAMLRAGAAADVLLSDHAMPGMDGLTLIETARRLRPGLPALLLTGNMEDGPRVEAALRQPGFRLLRKPAAAEELAAAIEAVLRDAGGASSAGRLAFPAEA